MPTPSRWGKRLAVRPERHHREYRQACVEQLQARGVVFRSEGTDTEVDSSPDRPSALGELDAAVELPVAGLLLEAVAARFTPPAPTPWLWSGPNALVSLAGARASGTVADRSG